MTVSNLSPSAMLFDGEDQLFTRCVSDADNYGEYGMGASTLWVLANTHATVNAVDTSREWFDRVVSQTEDKSRLHATWVDLGPLMDWGWPLTYGRRHHFNDYVEGVWRSGVNPDFVLIDGRFRVCCFLHSLLSAAPGTTILFDDYAGRPWYHVVEEFVPPVERRGRQSLFVVPKTFDRDSAREAREHFLYVRE